LRSGFIAPNQLACAKRLLPSKQHVQECEVSFKVRARFCKGLSISDSMSTVQLSMHDHIVPFIGACLDPPNFAMVYSYMRKGDLYTILCKKKEYAGLSPPLLCLVPR
jgi:serine/threonine protein kinase